MSSGPGRDFAWSSLQIEDGDDIATLTAKHAALLNVLQVTPCYLLFKPIGSPVVAEVFRYGRKRVCRNSREGYGKVGYTPEHTHDISCE
jgi:hypothetical protein